MNRGLAGEPGVYAVVALLVLAGALQQPLLLLIAVVLAVALGLTALWRRWCLRGIEYRRSLSQDRVFRGETVELRVSATNRKVLPVPWLEVEDELPEELRVLTGRAHPSYKTGRLVLPNLFSLRWYERVTRRYLIRCPERGYFGFGPVRLRSGDIFGFFGDERTDDRLDHVLVYPQVVPLEDLGLPSREPFGGSRTPQWLLEDPLRVAGVRDYVPGDSLRRIHWKASARSRDLQVKLQEPSTMLDVLIFLNVATVRPEWAGTIPELLEEAVTTAASVASHVFSQGYRVGLCANTNVLGSDQPVRLPPARDPDQMARILEALAKVIAFPTISMEQLLVREARNLPWGSTVLLVAAATTEGGMAALLRMKKAGHRVALLHVGFQTLPLGAEHVTVHRVAVGQ